MMNESKGLRWTANILRILLAVVFFGLGLAYFFMPEMPLDLSTTSGQFTAGLMSTGYFFPFLKTVEVIAGFMLFFKRWTALALIVLAPIITQIFLYNCFLTPVTTVGIIMSVVIVAIAAFLAWRNWEKYAPLFRK